MLKPSIYDFHDPTEVMILKNYAYLNMKEITGNLTLQEYDILHGMVHQNALCLYYAKSPYMQVFFTDHRTMTLDMTAYIANLILWKYPISYKVEEAIELLLDETFQTLTQACQWYRSYKTGNALWQCNTLQRRLHHINP